MIVLERTHIGAFLDPADLRGIIRMHYPAATGAFMNFIECGRFLPEMPVERLRRVVADRLQWLEQVGKPQWAAGLRMQLGLSLKSQRDLDEARQELESALALARRHPEVAGYQRAVYQRNLAELLQMKKFGAYTQAAALAQEVLGAATSFSYERWWAYMTLSYARLKLGDHEAAMKAAQESLTLARTMESP